MRKIRANPFFPDEVKNLSRELGVLWRELATSINGLCATGKANLDFGSVSSNGTAELTMSVPGVAVGDPVFLAPPAGIETGLVWCGYVSAASTVTIRIHNTTGGAVDPAAADWSVSVMLNQ